LRSTPYTDQASSSRSLSGSVTRKTSHFAACSVQPHPALSSNQLPVWSNHRTCCIFIARELVRNLTIWIEVSACSSASGDYPKREGNLKAPDRHYYLIFDQGPPVI